MTLKNDSFAVHEVTFHEEVDVADEEYGDALDTLDLDGGAPSHAPTSEPTAADEAHEDPAANDGSDAPAAPRRGLFARLFGWLLGR